MWIKLISFNSLYHLIDDKKEGRIMSKELTFHQLKEIHLKQLALYVPIVAKVHGQEHPEFHQVRKEYDKLSEKMNKNDDLDLAGSFLKLREITDNYTVPTDVCESYEAVYRMLEELDKAYHVDK